MKHTPLFIFMIVIVFIGCQNKRKDATLDSLLDSNVPKFIEVLPSLSHNDIQVAFKQANNVLNYKVKDPSSSVGAWEAWSEPEQNRNLALLACKLLPQSDANEFAISLILVPSLDDSTLLSKVERLMSHYKKTKVDGKPTWLVNNWLLQVKDSEIIYFPITSKSIFDLFKNEE